MSASPPGFLEICWPLVAGLGLSLVAPRLYDALATQQPWISWIVFPFVLLAGRPELGLSAELTRTLPQLILYIQFPLEGLLTLFNLRRRFALSRSLAQVAFLHLIGAFVLWLLSQPVQQP